MPTMGVIWLIAVIVFIVIEAITYQLVSVWFVAGSIAGAITYYCGGRFGLQMTIFIIVSAIMLIILRPLSVKILKTKNYKTNSDSLIGKKVLITKDVNNELETGEGKINGMFWTVRTLNNEQLKTGEQGTIKAIEGVKLIVEKGN